MSDRSVESNRGGTDFDAIERDLTIAFGRYLVRRRRQQRRLRLALLCTLGCVLLAGVALGAERVLNGPAPDSVRKDLEAVDDGLPTELRLNPDVVSARAVAESTTSVLYAAFLTGGGYCSEIVTDGARARGAVCTVARDVERLPISVTLPSDTDEKALSPVAIGGRVNRGAVASLDVRYGEAGPNDRIGLGQSGFFVFDVPAAHRGLARASGLILTARDSSGKIIGQAVVPADWASAAVPDSTSPLFVSTRSDSRDFTKVYGVEGKVSATGAARLELRYTDGAVVSIPLNSDGSYRYDVPNERAASFMRPQRLVALSAAGRIVAEAPVAAVAYWRGRERGR
jgi:hypothetical protein